MSDCDSPTIGVEQPMSPFSQGPGRLGGASVTERGGEPASSSGLWSSRGLRSGVARISRRLSQRRRGISLSLSAGLGVAISRSARTVTVPSRGNDSLSVRSRSQRLSSGSRGGLLLSPSRRLTRTCSSARGISPAGEAVPSSTLP